SRCESARSRRIRRQPIPMCECVLRSPPQLATSLARSDRRPCFPAFWPLYWALDRSERKVVGYRPPSPCVADAKDPAAAIARTNLARSACQIAYNGRSFAEPYFAGNPLSGAQDSHLRHCLRAGERPRRTGLLPDTERTSG